MPARIQIEDHQGAVVNSVNDAPILDAIVRGAARGGHQFNRADAAEMLFALLAMKPDDRLRLAARLSSPGQQREV